MTEDTPAPPRRDLPQLKRALLIALAALALPWLVKLVEIAGPDSFDWLGVRPRRLIGLIGILTAPLVHGSFEHLIFNSGPLFVLGTLMAFAYPRASRRAVPLIWLVSGVGVWLFARPSWHVGASGLTHGLMFFLFFSGLLRHDRLATAVSLIVFFLYGGMLATVLPQEPHVSWEYHLGGAIGGLMAALLWGRLDPAPPEPKPSWETEAEALPDDALEPPRPQDVPVLWQGPTPPSRGVVLSFPGPRVRPSGADGGPPPAH